MKREETSLLIDFYGSLLTKHQLNVLKMYYFDDFSMNEISENLNISKAAVSDIIKRSTKQIEDYEKALKLVEQHNKIEKVINSSSLNSKEAKDLALKIKKIIER